MTRVKQDVILTRHIGDKLKIVNIKGDVGDLARKEVPSFLHTLLWGKSQRSKTTLEDIFLVSRNQKHTSAMTQQILPPTQLLFPPPSKNIRERASPRLDIHCGRRT